MPKFTALATAAILAASCFAATTNGASARGMNLGLTPSTTVANLAGLVRQDIGSRVFENGGRQQNRRVEIVIKP
ncbi:hypothetical protein [Jiella pelagia]|uniref:ABC transporter substrate-binding protein n=1 Tax=Jiella pelagia TaxID=2986949 RepID=A0ABY7C0T6_9HYPH|nr:hypothetical protein [Jiella pelagia]WAP69712.1 hypothetical protein OH818_05760 [Jiella pelagia]